MIQPAFSFLVGAALPFSIASRRARGATFQSLLVHAIWRSVALMLLGIFLRSLERPQTYWTFEDTLTQIGLGYTFLFLLAFASVRVQAAVFTVILVGFWIAFVAYPLPGPDFDYTRVGVPADWPHLYSGFLAHFNKNSNLSWAFDVWFLNLFPREAPFTFNSGGWSTLSFIPTLATMQLGTWAGMWLQSPRSTVEKLKGLLVGGVALALAGLVLQWLHICPIVKRIWTPAYTLYSGGLVVLMLAGVLCGQRVEGMAQVVVLLPGDRRELDRDLRHELDDRALRHVRAGPPSRAGAVRGARATLRAGAARRRDARGVLGDSVVDVSAEDLPADLTLRGSGEDGENGDAHKRRNGVNGGRNGEVRMATGTSNLLAPRVARRAGRGSEIASQRDRLRSPCDPEPPPRQRPPLAGARAVSTPRVCSSSPFVLR